MYISITGFTLSSRLHAPRFWVHAVRSMGEAQRADGNLYAAARTVNGVHHTLTAWRDRAAMRAYLTMPRHLAAMKAFPSMGGGRTIGYEAQTVPSWEEALRKWTAEATVVPVPR